MKLAYRQRLQRTLEYWSSRDEEITQVVQKLLDQDEDPIRSFGVCLFQQGAPQRVYVFRLEDREIHIPPVGYAVKL